MGYQRKVCVFLPDMALFKFAKAISVNEPIKVFNNGRHKRDFTYIDDIVEVLVRVLDLPAIGNGNWSGTRPKLSSSSAPYKIYNLGNNRPTELMDYISALEIALNKKAQKEFLPIQAGDILETHADVSELIEDFKFTPNTDILTGVINFANWYKGYYRV
jgi:UDP-glucuronate 4-epimerase